MPIPAETMAKWMRILFVALAKLAPFYPGADRMLTSSTRRDITRTALLKSNVTIAEGLGHFSEKVTSQSLQRTSRERQAESQWRHENVLLSVGSFRDFSLCDALKRKVAANG
jgi:hypothetical protein